MPNVNPEILIWARKTAGLSEIEAAKRLGLSGPDRLRALESGERDPSRRQLVNMSGKYRRPLLTFYLPLAPEESDKGQDFRTLPFEQVQEYDAVLSALLRNVHARQGLVRAALEETEENESRAFVGSAQLEGGVEALVESMQAVLEFSAKEFQAEKTVDDAFSALREATEKAGVFVVLMGNLGTYHTDIDVRAFRGFALADSVAPFIVINEKDSRAAWSFTLLHELAHIFLGQTGISGYHGEAHVEKFCDAVAGRFLLDPADLAVIGGRAGDNFEEVVEQIGEFARSRNLSRKMVAYNLLRFGLIGSQIYRKLSERFDADRVAAKKAGEKRKVVVDYYTVRRHRVGPGLVNLVKRLVADRAMSTPKAGKVLGVRPTGLAKMFNSSRAA
jgi:Zn-dependent peptidase ImmA (M78 family)/transcriptional regulator with XRE-family HTH domain